MMKMTNKVLTSSLVILTAFGLAGCANSATAPATKTSTAATKVSKQANSSTNSQKAIKSHSDVSRVESSNDQNASTSSQTSNSTNMQNVSSATYSTATNLASKNQATSNSTPAQSDQQVLTSFVKSSGVQKDGNHYYVTPNKQNNNYQIEVRNNQSGDPNIAHLTGTYQYDPATNQIQEMNPITGNYDK
ncbi:hypothetical protein H5W18_06740 [Lactobacillus sp. Marseille-P7033]|nr:hypothetical protein [Lactobacillus sp. Marseille-P7033]NGC78053.1 hypothetical protein [Limosilactobacillus reuteri]